MEGGGIKKVVFGIFGWLIGLAQLVVVLAIINLMIRLYEARVLNRGKRKEPELDRVGLYRSGAAERESSQDREVDLALGIVRSLAVFSLKVLKGIFLAARFVLRFLAAFVRGIYRSSRNL